MALNNFDASIVGRSSKRKSRNVLAKAAYNNRDKFTDERTGQTFDYRSEGGLEWNGLFLPANAPDWMKDRQQLYMAMEVAEDRSTVPDKAQLAHSWILALPHELNAEQRRWLMTDFAREISRQGRVVDVAIHEPDKDGDHRNYHAHVMVAMREVTPDGFGKKIRAPGSGRDDEENNFKKWAKEELAKWKDRYSELGAKQLERAGFGIEAERFRHGHRTLQVQRQEALKRKDYEYARFLKDREPTIHMGPQATAMERDGVKTRKRERNEEIQRRNEARGIGPENWKTQNARDLEDILNPPRKPNPLDAARFDAEHVYWAFKNAKTAEEFIKDIEQRRLHVVRVTKEDADHSKVRHDLVKKFDNKYVPILREGEYVFLNAQGWAFRLNGRTTDKTPWEIKAFLKPLEERSFPSFREKWNELYEKSQSEKDFRPYGSRPSDKLKRGARTAVRDALSVSSTGVRLGSRVATKSLDAVSGLVESFFARTLSPEEKREAWITQEQRREDAERMANRERGGGRER